MYIAKLRISVNDAGVQYNNSAELETTHKRGDVLADGKIVRGLGTHFASQEAKDRYDKLVSRSNEIRGEFNRNFARFLFDGTYVVKPGEGRTFAEKFSNDRPDVVVDVFEYDISGDPDERELSEWSQRIKGQLKQFPLGRGEKTDVEGLNALKTLAGCPVLAKETSDAILRMVGEVEVGRMNRTDLKRGISLLNVKMDSTTLTAVPRSRPTPTATPA